MTTEDSGSACGGIQPDALQVPPVHNPADCWWCQNGFAFGAFKLRPFRFPAIAIPNRTKRWFHDWESHHEVKNAPNVPKEPEWNRCQLPCSICGVPEAIGTEIPRTDSGFYLGLPRTDPPITGGAYRKDGVGGSQPTQYEAEWTPVRA